MTQGLPTFTCFCHLAMWNSSNYFLGTWSAPKMRGEKRPLTSSLVLGIQEPGTLSRPPHRGQRPKPGTGPAAWRQCGSSGDTAEEEAGDPVALSLLVISLEP